MSKVWLFSGDDEATMAEAARQAVERLVGSEPDEFSLETVRETDGRDQSEVIHDFIGSALTPSFLGGVKTVWLQGFGGFAMEPAASVKNPGGVGKALRRLAEVIAGELPDDVNLVLSGTGVDPRKALAKACKEQGETAFFARPDVSRRGWEREVEGLLEQRSRDLGMRLSPPVVNYLLEVIGTDTGRIGCELEKLYCYAGDAPSLEQVQDICTGTREASRFALTGAFGKRDLTAVFTAIAQNLDHHKNPESACISMTRDMGRYFRDLLQIKLLMLTLRAGPRELGARVKNMSEAETAKVAGNRALSMSEWQLKFKAEEADRYEGPELVETVAWLAEFDRLNVSSALPRRLALETLATRIVNGQRHRRRTAKSR